jgi:hypothetical protein
MSECASRTTAPSLAPWEQHTPHWTVGLPSPAVRPRLIATSPRKSAQPVGAGVVRGSDGANEFQCGQQHITLLQQPHCAKPAGTVAQFDKMLWWQLTHSSTHCKPPDLGSNNRLHSTLHIQAVQLPARTNHGCALQAYLKPPGLSIHGDHRLGDPSGIAEAVSLTRF